QDLRLGQRHELEEVVQTLLGLAAIVERPHRRTLAGIEIPVAGDAEKAVGALRDMTQFTCAIDAHDGLACRRLMGDLRDGHATSLSGACPAGLRKPGRWRGRPVAKM